MIPKRRARRLQRSLFPSFNGLTVADLPRDALAALALTAIAVPGQLATARLMGLPARTGLLTFAAGTLVYAVFGRRRTLSVGADSTIATLMATALAGLAAAGPADLAALSAWVAALTGIVLMLVRPLRLGWIADLISQPMATGFLAGIAVHILAGAIPSILGFAPAAATLPGKIAEVAARIGETNVTALVLGLAVVATGLLAERIDRRLPGPLVALALAALSGTLLAPGSVAMLAPFPDRMSGPGLATLPGLDQFAGMVPVVLIVGLIVIMQTAAVVQTWPGGEARTTDPARDYTAIGLGSLASAAIGGFAVNSSPPRTAATEAAGARSQLAGIIAAAIALLLAFAGGGILAHIPEAALGGILCLIALRLIRPAEMWRIRRQSPHEMALVLATIALVVLLPVNEGVGLAVMLSLMHSIYVIARPLTPVLERVPGTTIWWALPPGSRGETLPGVMVFALGAPLSFLNARFILHRLEGALRRPDPVRLLVIEASGVIDLDYTGSAGLQQVIKALRSRGIDVALARLESERASRAARRTGLLSTLGADRIFHSVDEAVSACLPHPGAEPDPEPRAPEAQGRIIT